MAVTLLRRLAAGAAPPVFPLVGDGGRDRARALRIDRRLRVVGSPRHATVLLVVGDLVPELVGPARRVHDQVPEPRGVVVWSDAAGTPFPDATAVAADADPGPAVVALHRALMSGDRPSAPAIGPEGNPVEWRGVGPHGQGGKGMMGGNPYGRPMAMMGMEMRDGLMLDRLPVTLGPFLPWMPPGLFLDLELQGDVIQSLTPRVPALRKPEPLPTPGLPRARRHLGAVADLLAVLGLDGLAERTLRLAADLGEGDGERIRRFARRLARSGALRIATHGVGVVTEERAGARDHLVGDAEARWRRRLELAAEETGAGERLEAGPPPPSLRGRGVDLLPDLAAGQAFDAFVTTLVSLDLDPAAHRPTGGGEEEE